MDWTQNTNNIGFYLGKLCSSCAEVAKSGYIYSSQFNSSLYVIFFVGSLVVTILSGRGVSVCDFLVLSQTIVMMREVLA